MKRNTKMSDNELLLFDRLEVIRKTINEYGEKNFYLSFSGGKDSTVLHYMIDEALPDNSIPRVYLNTGIEFNAIVEFVKSLQEKDNRFIIIKPKQAIKPMLEKYGYPFKSKEHSNIVKVYQNSGLTKSVTKYLDENDTSRQSHCPKCLKYQFTDENTLNISNKCCYKLKKDVARDYERDTSHPYAITGMRRGEGGQRRAVQGCLTHKGTSKMKFHPLMPLDDGFEKWYIETRNIQLCKLYYPPFNFERTGCKGCPYNIHIQDELDVLEKLLPNERQQCETIWKPVYDEYRRIKYRLKK